jgi:hypothetical protein
MSTSWLRLVKYPLVILSVICVFLAWLFVVALFHSLGNREKPEAMLVAAVQLPPPVSVKMLQPVEHAHRLPPIARQLKCCPVRRRLKLP